ncbi:MAG: CBS domain-containing protein [Anaerolineales bacterium]|nr:CBS domain-containing protein [Anaerolineales bacterium]
MITIRHLLDSKGYEIWSILPNSTVYEALVLLAQMDIGALLVKDNDKVVGIFSERDYARKIILHGKSSKETLVREVMTHEVISMSPDQTIEECMKVMTNNRIRHIPVQHDDEVIGVVSIGDVVNAIISNQEFMIEQLENYIQGS